VSGGTTHDPQAAFEAFYDALARALDRVDPAQEAAFLARLCLLLGDAVGDAGRCSALVEQALAAGTPPAAC